MPKPDPLMLAFQRMATQIVRNNAIAVLDIAEEEGRASALAWLEMRLATHLAHTSAKYAAAPADS